jgi:galactosylceramidase
MAGLLANRAGDKKISMPYFETFESYASPADYGYLPRYTADIAGAFELTDRADGNGKCVRQVVPVPTISWAPDWLPYTILGDERWTDYEASADVLLAENDSAAVMGRVNHVGTGYGFVPKGYFFELSGDCVCRLVVVRGKVDKKKLVGDAEQQALIKAGKDEGEGGEKVLATGKLSDMRPGEWRQLMIRFESTKVTGLVDGKPVLSATDSLYGSGMAGLLANRAGDKKISMPYFDNVLINRVGGVTPEPSSAMSGQPPIYQGWKESR